MKIFLKMCMNFITGLCIRSVLYISGSLGLFLSPKVFAEPAAVQVPRAVEKPTFFKYGVLSDMRTRKITRPLLWRVSKKSKTVGYLFGTLHTNIPLHNLPPEVLETLNSADDVAMEAKPIKYIGGDEKIELDGIWRSLYKGDKFYIDADNNLVELSLPKITRKEYNLKLTKILEDFERMVFTEFDGIEGYLRFSERADDNIYYNRSRFAVLDMDVRRRITPYALMSSLSKISMFPVSYRTTNDNQLDTRLLDYADRKRKTITYLETPIEQLLSVARFPDVKFVKNLISSKNPIWEMRKYEASVFEAYYRGDAEHTELTAKNMEKQGYKYIVSERNQKWLPKIVSLFSQKNRKAFIFVGGLHFAGPDGLIKLLEKKSFTIERL